MVASRDDSSSRARGVKIGLVVVLFAAAGIIAYSSRTGEIDQPDTADTATTYVCVECGHGMDLTAAQYADLCKEAGARQDRVGDLRGYSFIRCPKCQKFAMVMGCKCPNDGTPVPQRTKDGKPGRCPKCGWKIMGQ